MPLLVPFFSSSPFSPSDRRVYGDQTPPVLFLLLPHACISRRSPTICPSPSPHSPIRHEFQVQMRLLGFVPFVFFLATEAFVDRSNVPVNSKSFPSPLPFSPSLFLSPTIGRFKIVKPENTISHSSPLSPPFPESLRMEEAWRTLVPSFLFPPSLSVLHSSYHVGVRRR